VRARIDAAAANGDAPYTVIVVPLLIETGAYRDLSQRILVVDCDEAQQVKRVMQRSGLTADAVRAIMAQQATREERLRHADDIVRNDGDIAALHAAVEALHQRYMALARATAA
jgi:dephospho-CoA kinase